MIITGFYAYNKTNDNQRRNDDILNLNLTFNPKKCSYSHFLFLLYSFTYELEKTNFTSHLSAKN